MVASLDPDISSMIGLKDDKTLNSVSLPSSSLAVTWS